MNESNTLRDVRRFIIFRLNKENHRSGFVYMHSDYETLEEATEYIEFRRHAAPEFDIIYRVLDNVAKKIVYESTENKYYKKFNAEHV